MTASGATRVSGSLNYKAKYAPGFPLVETFHTCLGKIVTQTELEVLGVVAAREEAIQHAARPPRPQSARRGWPSYQHCVEKAPPARDEDRPDISRADFTFCLLALDWGWGVEETAAKLMQESSKAQAEGEAYALRTALAAAKAIARRENRER